MSLKDYVLTGTEWDQSEHVGKMTSDVRDGFCRALVIYWLWDCVSNGQVTVASNFQKLIKSHSGNLQTIAKSQSDTSKIGGLNGLVMTELHLLQVTRGAVTVNRGGGGTWFKNQTVLAPVQTIAAAVNTSRTTPETCLVHLEWDGGFFSSGGAHAIGIVRESGGSTVYTYTVFDPNYGLLRAYATTFPALIGEIISAYSVDRLLAMPLQ